ncbi:alcohol dehydrogenase catalytic domain-containing protein [Candidatus Woesearchaeota archaeon]|nr:alcohol dehydrogenase catalytic domain-containing protein [Candidatus Woesearchaeota archaeon]
METIFAVGLKKDVKGIQSFYIPKPEIKKPTEVLIKIKHTGLDGTDFNMIKYDSKDIAENRNELVLGHELLGVVEEIGKNVKTVKKGDFVTMTVRRGCNICPPCLHEQSDMCMTGLFTERGIHKIDGFLTSYVVDEEKYILKLPKGLEKYGIFVEPLSIAEKGIEQIRLIQSRMPWACKHPNHSFDSKKWGDCKTAFVIGAGPLGILATCLLRLAGVNTYVLERKDEEHIKIKTIKRLGAEYIDIRKITIPEAFKLAGDVNIIFEASGASEFAINMIPHMSRSSIYVMTGIPKGELKATFDAHAILRQIVRYNQVIVGTVNSNKNHFEMAINDIPKINRKFGNILDNIITHRFKLNQYEQYFNLQGPNQLKIVVDMD